MNFEEKMKLAVQMAEYRISKANTGEDHYLAFTARNLPNTGNYVEDEYVRTVQAMFTLIQDLETLHDTSTTS